MRSRPFQVIQGRDAQPSRPRTGGPPVLTFERTACVCVRLRRGRAGFTLVELLVVVGLIALLAAGAGIALSDSGAQALAGAQKNVAGLVGAARAEAALHQTRARLYVYGTRPPAGNAERFLRLLQVFREDPAESNRFVAVGSPLYLPRGVYVVPNITTGLIAAGVQWPANPPARSTFAANNPQPLNPVPPPGSVWAGGSGYFFEFSAEGTLLPAQATHARLVLARGRVTDGLPQFDNPGTIRGLLIRSATGAVTYANDASGL